MRFARTCYDHLAGRLAVALADRLVEERAVVIDDETAVLTDRAPTVLASLGLDDIGQAQGSGKRPACRPCLDWGERRMHLAGRLGALLCTHCLQHETAQGDITWGAIARGFGASPDELQSYDHADAEAVRQGFRRRRPLARGESA